jgi:hypothetical protein
MNHMRMNIVSACLFDNRFCYITHLKGSTHPSLKRISRNCNRVSVLDLDSITENFRATPFTFKVTEALVGANNRLCHSDSNKRLVFLKSFNRLFSIPLLHDNTHRFQHMPRRENVLISKEIDDALIVYDTQQNYYRYCKGTGKLLEKAKLQTMLSNGCKDFPKEDLDFSGYVVYKAKENQRTTNDREKVMHTKNLFGHVLIYHKEKLEKQKQADNEFYGDRLKSTLDNYGQGKQDYDDFVGFIENICKFHHPYKLI